MDWIPGFLIRIWDIVANRSQLRLAIVHPETVMPFPGGETEAMIPLVFQATNRNPQRDNSIERLEASMVEEDARHRVGVWRKEQPWGRPLKPPQRISGLAAVIDIDLPVVVPSGHSVKFGAQLYLSRESLPNNATAIQMEFRDAFKVKHTLPVAISKPISLSIPDGK